MNKSGVFLSCLAVVALSSCGRNNPSSFSSETSIDVTETLTRFENAGKTLGEENNLGFYSDDLTVDASLVRIGDDGDESISLSARDLKVEGKDNNAKDEDAKNLKASLVFSEGSIDFDYPAVENVSFTISRFRPAVYLDNYNVYLDLSKNGIIRLALQSLIRDVTIDKDWTFPENGKGYYSLPKYLLNQAMPLSSGYDSLAEGYRDAFESVYEESEESISFNDDSIKIDISDKETIATFACSELEARNPDWTEQEKKDNKEKIDKYLEAATINSFKLGFGFSSKWESRSFDVDIDFDLDTLKANFEDEEILPTSIYFSGNMRLLSGTDAEVKLPADIDQYSKISTPSF